MILDQVTKLPQAPGVYIFRNKRGQILYIGKATRLRDRVSQYFGPHYAEERKRRMIPEITQIDFKVTETPIEALLIESELIKKHQPPFNVEWKDDKRYLYLGITREAAPRIFLTHQPTLRHVVYLGPFVEKASLVDLMRLLLQFFGLRRARRVSKKLFRRATDARSREKLAIIRTFLKRGLTPLGHEFEKKMIESAEERQFERAAYYRDKIKRLERYRHQQAIAQKLRLGEHRSEEALVGLVRILRLKKIPRRIEGYDLAHLAGEAATGAMVVALDGIMVPSEYRQFKIKRAKTKSDVDMLAEVLTRRFKHSEWPRPDLVLVDGGKPQVATARRVLPRAIPFIGLAKRDERIVIPQGSRLHEIKLLRREPALRLLQTIRNEAHRFSRQLHHKLRRRSID